MKKGVEKLYEGLSRKKTRRRRMVSLLLVLSMFVTSGVSWSLHGVGMTMANEAECGAEEHIHSEECYEKQLVCGLEDDAGHEHSEDCYEDVLVCEKDEHIHDVVCYTGEEPAVADEDEEFDDSDYAVMNGYIVSDVEKLSAKDEEAVSTAPASGENTDTGGTLSTEAASAVSSENGTDTGTTDICAAETSTTSEEELLLENRIIEAERLYADGDEDTPQPPTQPSTIQTIDNIAEGIKFTLFDYDGCDDPSNNYDYRRDWNNGGALIGPPYEHPNVSTGGINTGRNAKDDILFFAYGTPVPDGANGAVVQGGDTVYNYTDENGQHYHPDKNSYAGDYNADPPYSGNRAVQGIVESNLGPDGYPRVSGSGNSLAYLFNNTSTEYKTVYNGDNDQGVNKLLRRETSANGVDHLIYNSDEHYAYFNKETNEFEVYNDTFRIINGSHHMPDDINPKTNEAYGGNPLNPNFNIGFFPFDEYDEAKKDPNFDVNNDDYRYNHHFGMKMEATFVNNKFDRTNVKEPIIFKYSGDDDMWVFVDGKLVLDLGGIHEPAGGMIDFSHGLVWSQDNGATSGGRPLDDVHSYLTTEGTEMYNYIQEHAPELINGYKVYDEHGQEIEGAAKTAAQAWEELPKPIILNTSQDSTDKWIVRPITDYIPDWYTNTSRKAYGDHDIKMFYLERGGCYSNLAMEMNLPTVKPLSIVKDVEYGEKLAHTYDNTKYWFQVYEWDDDIKQWIIPQDTNPDADYYLPGSRFSIRAGERMKFDNLGQERKFKIVEIGFSNDPNATGPEAGITTEVFRDVEVTDKDGNLVAVALENGNASTGGAALKENNSYNYKNTIQEDFTTIRVKKKWEPTNAAIPDFTVKFKIMRTDSVTGEVRQVALKQDGVKKRTFTISSAEWAQGVVIDHLLSQYGDHHYTYTVEELNVPKGFNAGYGSYDDTIDVNGVSKPGTSHVITNTQNTKMQINVEKQWENVSGQEPQVVLKLRREKVGYLDSEPTALIVNMVDEGGNPIMTKTITKDEELIYAGGSAELRCDLPRGAVAINDGVISKSPESLSAVYDEGFVVLNDLAPVDPAHPDDIPNVVTVQVDTSKAEDPLLLLHHSFSGSTNGWIANSGEHTVSAFEDDSAYAKGSALLVDGRDAHWHGARLNLDPAIFKANRTYTFSTYVRYDGAPDQIPFKFTFNDGLNKDNNGSFYPISDLTYVPKGEWVQLIGTLPLPEEVDPYNMYIIVETNGNNSQITSFMIDEFTAVEGNSPVKIQPDSGIVIISGPLTVENTEVYNFTFNSATLTDGWSKNGNPSLKVEDGKLVIQGRGNDNDASIQRSVSSLLLPGHTYRFELGSQRDGNNAAGNVHLSIQYAQNGSTVYSPWLCDTQLADTNDNHHIYYSKTSDFPIPADADMSNARMYFGTNNDTRSFRLRYLKITDITTTSMPVSGDKDGYEIIDGKYYSNYSNYDIVLDPDSVTNPLRLKSDYEVDPGWEKVVTLPVNSDDWTYHWDNDLNTDDDHRIDEDNQNFLYRYWIEEISIGGEPVESSVVEIGDGKNVSSTHPDYLISYDRQFVATNDEDNPILVKNKYIWYKLPATGGIGVDLIYALGILLAITGFIGGSALKIRERRSG